MLTLSRREKFIVSTLVGLGIAFIIWGFNVATTGRDAQNIPDVIERMSPGPGDQVPQQSQIVVDFIEGYDAILIIDDVELPKTRLDELTADANALRPGSQVNIPPTAIYDPGNFVISFLPQPGAPFVRWSQGEHVAQVVYWKITDGQASARTFRWTFEAN
jgi:hypothetical protein